MSHDVFISYSFKDKKIADAICNALESEQIRCWIAPRDVLPGVEWGEAIVEAIAQAKIMVLVFSASANRSQQVLREVERAVNKNVIIIPFRIENVLPTKSMEYFLYSTHWLDALTPDIDKHIEQLKETVIKLRSSKDKKDNYQMTPPAAVPSHSHKHWKYLALGMMVSMFVFGILALLYLKPSGHNVPVQVDDVGMKEQEVGLATGRNDDSPELPKAGSEVKPEEPQPPVQQPRIPELPAPVVEPKAQPALPVQPPSAVEVDNISIQLKVGDYIRFGNYNGQPIDWRVINIDEDGKPLLFATKIISVKPFSAAQSGAFNQSSHGRKFDTRKDYSAVYMDYSAEELRQMKGSNNWYWSSLRDWLNSREKRVKYSSAPPSANAISGSYRTNSYDDEPGFLYNFSSEELNLIKPVTRRILLSVSDQSEYQGGTELYAWDRNTPRARQAIANYDKAYFKNVKDRVFLLSIKEVVDYVEDRGWKLKAALTSEAAERDNLKIYRGNYAGWWLVTPRSSTSCETLFVTTEGTIASSFVSEAGYGVRPALYLVSSKLALTGKGKETEPYVCLLK